jgi:hypothetical protein
MKKCTPSNGQNGQLVHWRVIGSLLGLDDYKN